MNQDGPELDQNSVTHTKDISVLQLLTRLVVETERLIRLADDINQNATTPQAKAGMNLIGSEVNSILQIIKLSIEPLYGLYEIDPGMRGSKRSRETGEDAEVEATNEYDEGALWSEVARKKEFSEKPKET